MFFPCSALFCACSACTRTSVPATLGWMKRKGNPAHSHVNTPETISDQNSPPKSYFWKEKFIFENFMSKNNSGGAFLIPSWFDVTWDAFVWLGFIAFGLCVCSVCSALFCAVLRCSALFCAVLRAHCATLWYKHPNIHLQRWNAHFLIVTWM